MPSCHTGLCAQSLEKLLREKIANLIQVRWRPLPEAAKRLGVSVRTLRRWIALPVDPLPCAQVDPQGKLLIHDGEADEWLKRHRAGRDLDQLANEILEDFAA